MAYCSQFRQRKQAKTDRFLNSFCYIWLSAFISIAYQLFRRQVVSVMLQAEARTTTDNPQPRGRWVVKLSEFVDNL
jgi:hypothetical protein